MSKPYSKSKSPIYSTVILRLPARQSFYLFFIADEKADVFQCSWGDIPITFQCDGINNCGDNSDEENCNKGNIKKDIFE